MDRIDTVKSLTNERDKYREALSLVPVVLQQLGSDGRDFFAIILQAMFEAGCEK